jgi:hypothetical protein
VFAYHLVDQAGCTRYNTPAYLVARFEYIRSHILRCAGMISTGPLCVGIESEPCVVVLAGVLGVLEPFHAADGHDVRRHERRGLPAWGTSSKCEAYSFFTKKALKPPPLQQTSR